jgi:excinuclease ABC subunit C
LVNPLEEIDGLGAKKIQSLLRHFGGYKHIEHANESELCEAPGIGKQMAARIYAHLRA